MIQVIPVQGVKIYAVDTEEEFKSVVKEDFRFIAYKEKFYYKKKEMTSNIHETLDRLCAQYFLQSL